MMIDNEKNNTNILTEKQRKLISDNWGLLKSFYKKEIDKGYIPSYKKEEFFGQLQKRFCSSASNYEEGRGFKFSTYVYGGFGFCVKEIKKSIVKDRGVAHLGILQDVILSDQNIKDGSVKSQMSSIWNSINGWKNSSNISHKEIVDLINRTPLSDREKKAVNAYYIDGCSLAQIGKKMGVCKERIRQILLESCIKIKVFIKQKGYERSDFIDDI